MAIDDLLRSFPNLRTEGSFEKTSDETDSYNCIAWAAQDTTKWWSPLKLDAGYWPFDTSSADLDVFIRAFENLGYSKCDSYELEENFEKIAIYVDSCNIPTHVARQLPTGKWTSKCGGWEDLTHELQGLEGDYYGRASVFMKRKV